MKSNRISLMTLALMTLAGAGFGQTLPVSSNGTLPPGHPPMTGMPANAAGWGNAAGGSGGTEGTGALPANHPSMADIMAANPTATPGTQPAAVIGSLTIQTIQGSTNPTPLANDSVTVELFHRGTPVRKFSLKLDAEGKITVPDIPVMPPVQALVSVLHDGLVQQVVSPELSPANLNQTLQMRVYESTQEQPAWTIAMQHMIVQWTADGSGIHVTEMISANSPIDRAWIGAKGEGDKPVTMTIALPANADQVELGGSFDEDASRMVEGKLVTGSPLFPGRSEYRLSYNVPAKDGAVDLPVSPPAATANLIVFLPADDVQVTPTGLTGGMTTDMGEGKVRMYRAQNLSPGALASLSIRGIKAVAEPVAASAAGGKFSARNVAMAGAFLMVLAGAAMMLMKKPQVKKA